MFTLLANIGPPLHPEPTSPASEWVIWGAFMGLVAFLSGRAIKRRRSSRDTFVGVALLFAVAFAVCNALFKVWKSHEQ